MDGLPSRQRRRDLDPAGRRFEPAASRAAPQGPRRRANAAGGEAAMPGSNRAAGSNPVIGPDRRPHRNPIIEPGSNPIIQPHHRTRPLIVGPPGGAPPPAAFARRHPCGAARDAVPERPAVFKTAWRAHALGFGSKNEKQMMITTNHHLPLVNSDS